MRACACVGVYVRAFVRARARGVLLRSGTKLRVCVRACVRVCVCARARVDHLEDPGFDTTLANILA